MKDFNNESICFGVTRLDKELDEITNNDFILIGSLMGEGKTEVLVNIAVSNARMGKKVHYLALKNYEHQYTDGIVYRKNIEYYYEKLLQLRHEKKTDLSFSGWTKDRLGKKEQIIEKEAISQMGKGLETFNICYGEGSMSLKELTTLISSIQNETDLIIIDDLFGLDNKWPPSTSCTEQLIGIIGTLGITIGKPIILGATTMTVEKQTEVIFVDSFEKYPIDHISGLVTKMILMRTESSDGPKLHYSTDFMVIGKDNKKTDFKTRCIWNYPNNVWNYPNNVYKIGAPIIISQT